MIKMLSSRIVICFIFIIVSADSTQFERSSNETSVDDATIEQITESTDAPDVSFNVSDTTEDKFLKTSSTGSSHDIEITGHISPSSLSDETDPLEEFIMNNKTTNLDTFTDTSDITTTEITEVQSACSTNPCRNNGICIEDSTIPLLFSCDCPSGYVGIRCGTKDKCVTDDKGEICKNGACIYSMDGSLRSCQCFNEMFWDKTKKKCRDPDPPCFPNPCMNDGICIYEDNKTHCDCPSNFRGENCSYLFKCGKCENGICQFNDDQTIKYCKCDEGFYWNEKQQTCSVMHSICDSSPCLNGGICVEVSDTEFNCSCKESFSGKTCEIKDKCSEDKDCGSGTCKLSSDKKIRICQCNKGFYLEEKMHTCKVITNICQPNPCLNDGICTIVSENAYNCTCSQGYVGKKCDVRDMCEMDGGISYCGTGNCSNNHEQRVYFCTCEEGKYFQYSQRKCVELDMCPLMRCGSMETCIKGECVCKKYYKWNNDTKKCMPDFCSTKPCPLPEMVCEEGTGKTDYKCYCPEGYSFNGDRCTQATCILPKLNPCNQYCSITEDEYKCSCAADFDLKEDNHTCSYIGNDTCTNKTCDNGFCVKEDEMETCICPPGFTELDGKCIDMCSSGDLMPGICPSDECEAISEGGFRCKCEGKFALSKDKSTCMVRNICDENEIGGKTCSQRNGECIVDWHSLNGYHCVCGNGKVLIEGGICRDICSLENNQRQCSIKGATCDVDNKGGFICNCPPYFEKNVEDGKCSRPADFSYLVTLPLDRSSYLTQGRQKKSLNPSINHKKISSDITVTMREMLTSFTQANILSCKIISEYILCKIELQFTSESESELKRLKTEDICLENGKSSACLLPPSLVLVKNKILENVHIEPTNPCVEEIKNEICGSETTCVSSVSEKNFNCSCKPGFYKRMKNYPFGDTKSFIEMCSDIDECTEGNPCPEHSKCENTIGSYICSCIPGYRNLRGRSGSESQKCIEVCHPSPCMHGHCSRRGDNEFDCRCDAGYAGTLCDLQDEHYKSAKTNTIIVGVVLGGALLITFILFAACISRLRKKKMIENSGHMFYTSTEMTERRRGEGGAVNNAFQRE